MLVIDIITGDHIGSTTEATTCIWYTICWKCRSMVLFKQVNKKLNLEICIKFYVQLDRAFDGTPSQIPTLSLVTTSNMTFWEGHFGRNFLLFDILLIIPFNLICHMTMLWKTEFLIPIDPLSTTPRAWPVVTTKILYNMLYIYRYWVYVQNVA